MADGAHPTTYNVYRWQDTKCIIACSRRKAV